MTDYLVRSHRHGDRWPVSIVYTNRRQATEKLRELEADERIIRAEIIERGTRRRTDA